jgi:NAD+ synthase
MFIMKLPEIDTWKVEKFLTEFIHGYLKKAGRDRVVLGLSGGIDSAVAATLAREALGRQKVIALILPSRNTLREDLEDAQNLCQHLNIKSKLIDIAPMVTAYFEQFPHADWLRRGNKIARERMSIIYDWAAYHQALVLGTSNRTELLLGYFTKFGDGAADLEPLGNLYKNEVRQLARSLGIAAEIIDKTPSAGLWKGQTDEKELGFSYDLLDSLLYHMYEKKLSPEELVKAGFNPDTIETVSRRVKENAHKLKAAPIPHIPSRWRR